MTQDLSLEQIAEWHARTADVERDPEIRAFHRRAARALQAPCERVTADPIAHGPFFDGLQDMPYGGSRQTTQPIETPDDATTAILELQTLNGECCTCLSISRDPMCVHHGDVDKVASVNHGPTLQEAQATIADHYGHGWLAGQDLASRQLAGLRAALVVHLRWLRWHVTEPHVASNASAVTSYQHAADMLQALLAEVPAGQ